MTTPELNLDDVALELGRRDLEILSLRKQLAAAGPPGEQAAEDGVEQSGAVAPAAGAEAV